MKILQVVPSYKPAYVYGGTVESVSRLCEALANAGTDVTVYTTNANGAEELDVETGKEQLVDGVKVIYFKRVLKDPFYISPALWKQLYQNCRQYDVVHLHSWWNMIVIVAAFICQVKGAKLVISPHGMFSDYILNNSKKTVKRFIHAAFGKSLLKKSRFHATSEAEHVECTRLIPGWKGFVISNIVWLPPLAVSRKVNDCFTIVYLSRIHPKKGIELLMEAISRLPAGCKLKIAGSGDEHYIERLKVYAASLRISEKIEWLGWKDREEKFTALMQADVFALTSYNENFGNVVIEALYAGTPVVISGEVGVCSFVEKNALGWICQPNSGDITTALQAAMDDMEERKRIASVAPTLAKKSFSEESLLPLYLHHYRENG